MTLREAVDRFVTRMERTLLNMVRNEWSVDAGSARIKLHKVDNTRVRYLSREHDAALLDACEPHVRAIVTVAAHAQRAEDFLDGLQLKAAEATAA